MVLHLIYSTFTSWSIFKNVDCNLKIQHLPLDVRAFYTTVVQTQTNLRQFIKGSLSLFAYHTVKIKQPCRNSKLKMRSRGKHVVMIMEWSKSSCVWWSPMLCFLTPCTCSYITQIYKLANGKFCSFINNT